MPRKTIEVSEKLWREFVSYAVRLYGTRGAIAKGIKEALSLWIERQKQKERAKG
jgi:hypothetical protein